MAPTHNLSSKFNRSINGAVLLQECVDERRSHKLGKIRVGFRRETESYSVTIHIHVESVFFELFLGLDVICRTSFLQFDIYELTEQFEVQAVLSAHNNEHKASAEADTLCSRNYLVVIYRAIK